MSGLLGGKPPAPQPVPVNPVNDAADQAKRLEAERTAIAESKARGRASTIAAGGDEAADKQLGRGMLKSTQRRTAAASEMLG